MMQDTHKLIPLTKGQFAIVDYSDYGKVRDFKWHLATNGYAIRSRIIDGKRVKIHMHRVINQTPEGMDTDHINCNKLDNRKANLRSATRSENKRNTKTQKNNKSGVKGVSWNKTAKKWQAEITLHQKSIYLGVFTTVQEAEVARNKATIDLHGAFGRG